MMNQQLANQISAATSAKQAQLRAIQQGMQNRNKNKPVSTVEPFQRQAAVAAAAAQAAAAVQAAVASTANDNGQVGMPLGTPRSRPFFNSSIPRGIKFGTPRIPKVSKKACFETCYFFFVEKRVTSEIYPSLIP